MSLAIVTEVASRFRQAVAKWNTGDTDTLESRFLLHDGIYIGNLFRLGSFEGRWLAEDNALKIYRDGQWLMTVPLELEVEKVDSRVPVKQPAPSKAA